MKQSELRDKLKKVKEKMGCFVSVSIYLVDSQWGSRTQYRFGWVPDKEGFSKEFPTLAELVAYMDKLLEE